MLELFVKDALRELPEEAGEAAEGWDEEGEDRQEDDVGAKGADHVHEAQEAHVQLEVCEGRGETRARAAGSWVGGVIGDRSIVVWGEGCRKGEPEGAE